jgi:hypothetical protein
VSPKTLLNRMAVLGLGLTLVLALISGCGGANRVTPGTQEEAGSISDLGKEKPSVYTVKAGDTLASIAAKPEIYGEAALWPLLLSANQDVLQAGKPPKAGTKLLIRRDLIDDDKEAAREQAKLSGTKKGKPAVKKSAAKPQAKPEAAKAVAKVEAVKPQAKPETAKPAAKAPAKPTSAPTQAMVSKPADISVTAKTAEAAPVQPVSAKKRGMLLPILLIFLFVLLMAAVILLYVMRRDSNKE